MKGVPLIICLNRNLLKMCFLSVKKQKKIFISLEIIIVLSFRSGAKLGVFEESTTFVLVTWLQKILYIVSKLQDSVQEERKHTLSVLGCCRKKICSEKSALFFFLVLAA